MGSRVRAAIVTVWPASSRKEAVLRPMPDDAPVIKMRSTSGSFEAMLLLIGERNGERN